MKGWFHIEGESSDCLIRLTMGGFFDSSTISEMRRDFVRAIVTLPCPANLHVTLCDIRQMEIQSQAIVGEFTQLVGSDDVRSRRLAFVTTKSLARLQARRLTSRDGVEFFTAVDAALEWLRQ